MPEEKMGPITFDTEGHVEQGYNTRQADMLNEARLYVEKKITELMAWQQRDKELFRGDDESYLTHEQGLKMVELKSTLLQETIIIYDGDEERGKAMALALSEHLWYKNMCGEPFDGYDKGISDLIGIMAEYGQGSEIIEVVRNIKMSDHGSYQTNLLLIAASRIEDGGSREKVLETIRRIVEPRIVINYRGEKEEDSHYNVSDLDYKLLVDAFGETYALEVAGRLAPYIEYSDIIGSRDYLGNIDEREFSRFNRYLHAMHEILGSKRLIEKIIAESTEPEVFWESVARKRVLTSNGDLQAQGDYFEEDEIKYPNSSQSEYGRSEAKKRGLESRKDLIIQQGQRELLGVAIKNFHESQELKSVWHGRIMDEINHLSKRDLDDIRSLLEEFTSGHEDQTRDQVKRRLCHWTGDTNTAEILWLMGFDEWSIPERYIIDDVIAVLKKLF